MSYNLSVLRLLPNVLGVKSLQMYLMSSSLPSTLLKTCLQVGLGQRCRD